MGKWTEVARRLEPAADQPGAFQDEVQAYKEKIADRKPATLAREYLDARDAVEALERGQLHALKVRRAAFEQLARDTFQEHELHSLKLDDGRGLRVDPDISVSVTDRTQLYAWAQEHGYAPKFGLAHPTVSSIVKERLEAGDELPPGVEVRAWFRVKKG